MLITADSASKSEPYIPIADFYAGKSVFITGGTGFIGKVLTEKLLCSCPDIESIYLLIREKKNIPTNVRAKSYTDCPIFSRIRKERPENVEKIKFVNGDLTKSNLGLGSEDLNVLLEEVCIVFHVAATVKFNEPLSVAVKVNVEGTEEVLKLAQNMKNIEVFLYMSTAYSNTNQERLMVEETMYPCPKPIDEVYRMIEENNKNEVFGPEVLDGRPNTYTFTKALAEHLIFEKHGNLPAVIIRPSIVTAAKKEPLEGWLVNWSGPTLALFTGAKGWCRTMYGDDRNMIDIIPVDQVVNLTIVAAARNNRSKDVAIYHSCSSDINPISYKVGIGMFINDFRRQGIGGLPFPGICFTNSDWIFTLRTFFYNKLPAYIADVLLYITGQPLRYIKMEAKMKFFVLLNKYFTSHNFLMKMQRGQALYRSLSSEDQEIFDCDPANIEWKEYLIVYLRGIRRFLLKNETTKQHRNNEISLSKFFE